MLADMQNELQYVRREMHKMAEEYLELVARAQAVQITAEDEANAEDTQDRPHRNANFQGVANEAASVLEQLVTLTSWAANDQSEDQEAPKYRITQMVKDGRTYWVVVLADESKKPWPVYSSPYRHMALEECNRLNAPRPVGKTMYQRRKGL